MNSILIDTNAYAAFKRGQPDALAIVQHAPLIAVSTVVLGELLSGFSGGQRGQANHAALESFLSSDRVTALAVDRDTAAEYASIYAQLRKAGTPVPTNDMWIAATARQHGLQLFSFDMHFRQIAGLHVGCALADFTAP